MNVTSEKVRQLWLPFLILAVIILVASWLLANFIYPNDIRGGEVNQPVAGRSTPTQRSSIAPTSTISTTQSTSPGPSPTLDQVSLRNCTYTRFYWREHPESWMIENVIVSSLSFTKAEALEILASNELLERTILLREFFAALLNTLKGADAKVIELTLIEASKWLNAYPSGVELSQSERVQAQALAQELSDYNNGFTGPGHCPDEPLTPTPVPSPTATPTHTPTITPLVTTKPTATETPFSGGGGPPKTSAPTNTSPPGTEPPGTQPPPPPTNPPPPTPMPTPTTAPTQPPPTTQPTSVPEG